MAYAAVTSLMETLTLNFLQSQPPFPLEHLAAQIRDYIENVGLRQQNLHMIVWGTILLTTRFREMAEVKQKIVSLHQNLRLLQQSLDKSEIPYDDARVRVMKDLEAQIRDASFNAEERIEMELIAISLAKDSLLHEIFNEAKTDTDYQMRDGNENLSFLKQIVEAQIREIRLDEEASLSKLRTCKKACLPRLYRKELARLIEVVEVKQKMLSLHQMLDILQKSKIGNYDERAMKDLEAEIRGDVWFKAEERIEMELSTIYLAKDSLLHITACLLKLHEIFIEAEKQIDYHRNELIRNQTEYQLIAKAASSQNERITDVSLRQRGPQLVKGSSLHDLVHKKNTVSNFSRNASKLDGEMVGCEKLFEKILDQLLTQQTTKARQVVSIVGMGGIGKTTLTHKLYEHPLVTSHFDKRAWVTVSQEYNVEQMLRCLLSCVTTASRDGGQDELAERLYKCLKGQRYLIVIDDIWNTTAWDSVQRCFPDDNGGSCILLTSRLKEVAEYASSGNSIINMPFLDADESWSLYCKVFGKIEFTSKFEQIGRDIVKKCKGLPLAITVVASLLSKTEEEEEKWKFVAKSVTDDSNDACSRILYLSYNQLPHHLKACFLYFGNFEEDYEIPVKKLVRLWVAEGFFSTVKNVNMEKVAMEWLQDLVDRSLVIVSKQSYNGEMKRIGIHDLLRDLCLREARLENLLNVIGAKKPCRWISHISTSLHSEVRFEDECFHKSHSFHLKHLDYYWHSVEPRRLFSHLKLLRVVDIRGILSKGDMALNVLENLVHLRYLALSTFNTFDVKLFDHWNMQSFIVSGAGVTMDSSETSRIWKMPLLKNFCIGRIFSLESPSVVHRNLENISWLDSKLCTKDMFTMLPNLEKLGVEGGKFDNYLDWFYNVVHLGQLETLSIRRWGDLNNIPLSRFPCTTSLPNLKKLIILESYLLWSELSPISMLPNLEVLKLIHACTGEKWETYDEGFHRLKRLVIKSRSLQYWNVVGDHFPVLECLEISESYWLKEIPRGFADITTLALIQLSKCGDSVLASAKWIQEEQNNNYGNDALLVRFENILTYDIC